MATRVIGLDVGTNAVRAVEVEFGDTPQVHRMGQVALSPGAVVDGEVADVAAVATALRRLWSEARFTQRAVRVGISSPRVIVRTIEMPPMSHDELMSTIKLQLDDYVPLPPDDTVFGVRALDWSEAGQPNRSLLLAATHRDAVEPLLEALNRADLTVAAVDVLPAALALALTERDDSSGDDGPVDVIVSIGAGTVVVVAARAGEVLFSRTLTQVCGRTITERIANEVAVDASEAERRKRDVGAEDPTSVEVMPAAASAVTELIGEIRASLEFYAQQAGSRPVRRVLLTGGGSLTAGLLPALADELALAVELADPFARVRMGRTGFDAADAPFMAPYVAAALGVALGASRPKDRRIDLTPVATATRSSMGRRALIGIGAVVLIGATGTLYLGQRSQIEGERADLATAEAALTAAQTDIMLRADPDGSSATAGRETPGSVAASVAPRDVDWLAVLAVVEEKGAALGVVISSFQGVLQPVASALAPADATESAATPLASLSLTATAPDMTAVADWLDLVSVDPRFSTPWVAGITVIDETAGPAVQFTMDLGLTELNLVERSFNEEAPV